MTVRRAGMIRVGKAAAVSPSHSPRPQVSGIARLEMFQV